MALPMREAMLAGFTEHGYRVLYEVISRTWVVQNADGIAYHHADSELGQRITNELGER